MRLSALMKNQQREVISARKMSLERMQINTRHINSTRLQLPLLDYTLFFRGVVPLKARVLAPVSDGRFQNIISCSISQCYFLSTKVLMGLVYFILLVS